jgi:hypothetical protein
MLATKAHRAGVASMLQQYMGCCAAVFMMTIISEHDCSLDRIDQVELPLDNEYKSGAFDGRGVHGEPSTGSG